MQSKRSAQICEVCSASFYVKPSRIAAGYGRFCSGTCYGAQKRTRVEITCVVCGAARMAKPVDVARGAKFCSDACARADKAPTEASAALRFWQYVDKTDGCWLWTGARISTGYGNFCVSKTPPVWETAHRYAWTLAYGPIPDGLFACHTCDVRACVNPDHLFIGTQQNNMDDMARKQRQPNRKLTRHQVVAIRRDHAAGVPRQALAAQYGVTPENVDAIVRYKTWKHVP